MTWQEEFLKTYHGNDKFPKRISDPILCDDIVDFISKLLASRTEEIVAILNTKNEIEKEINEKIKNPETPFRMIVILQKEKEQILSDLITKLKKL